MMILGFAGVGYMAFRRRKLRHSQPDRIAIENTETAYGRSFCL
jgi:hypothetical protein